MSFLAAIGADFRAKKSHCIASLHIEIAFLLLLLLWCLRCFCLLLRRFTDLRVHGEGKGVRVGGEGGHVGHQDDQLRDDGDGDLEVQEGLAVAFPAKRWYPRFKGVEWNR